MKPKSRTTSPTTSDTSDTSVSSDTKCHERQTTSATSNSLTSVKPTRRLRFSNEPDDSSLQGFVSMKLTYLCNIPYSSALVIKLVPLPIVALIPAACRCSSSATYTCLIRSRYASLETVPNGLIAAGLPLRKCCISGPRIESGLSL